MEGAGRLAERIAGIVLAGGLGTRLFPLTQSRCKPAVGFGGRYRLIDIPLSNALNSKITQLFVISQHFASTLHHHILTTYRFDLLRKGGIELLSPEEAHEKKIWFEGTADAVRKNLDHILQSTADYFLILSGDQLYNMDLEAFVQFAVDKKADMVVASLYVDASEAQRMGVMKTDEAFCIKEFYEKPKEKSVIDRFQAPKGILASMGIYVFRRDVLFQLLQEQGNDFGHHLIPFQAAKGNSFSYVYEGYWVDIGTIKSFYDANMALLERNHCLNTYDETHPIFTLPQNLPSPFLQEAHVKQSYISQGSIVEGAEIDHSILGMRCCIKKGTRIHRSILMGNQFYAPPAHQHPPLPSSFHVGENCLIEKAIIDEHASIGNGVQLVNKKNLQTYQGEGICIRDGIIIVQAGATIPNGFKL